MLFRSHQYYSSGPCDMLVYVSCYDNYAVHILSATSYLNNVITIDDLRLVSNSTTRKYYLDIHYKFNSINGIGVDIIGTTAQVDWLVDSTRMNLEPVDTLPDGETVVKTAEWENPPMELGVEYRTTERYQGKPVYTKLLSGVMLGQDKRLDIPLGISNLQCIFDARGNLGNAIIPYYAPNNQFSSTAYGMHVWTGTELVFVESTGYSYAGSTVYVQIKYIKTKN